MNEQIDRLNDMVKVRIAPSPIHGVGVFAIRDIAKGQKIYADNTPEVFSVGFTNLNKALPEVKELILERFPNIVNGSMFVFPTDRVLGYMNHGLGEAENYDAVNDVALRDIPRGTELLEDYTKIPNYDKVYTWLLKEKKEGEKE